MYRLRILFKNWHRIRPILVLNTGLLLFGIIGYSIIEDASWLDALYMTVITSSSVGFGEVIPLSTAGRLFTIFYIIIGVGSVAVSFSFLVDTILSAELRRDLRDARMERKLSKVKDHVIICGYGRVGKNAGDVLADEINRDIVIIDNGLDPDSIDDPDALLLFEDATDDDVLRKAGIEQAWGLLAATADDARNLFIVVSARALNPNLTIVARTSTVDNESKMLHAGADRVVSPYDIGGKRMANSLLRPQLTEFIDGITLPSGVELLMEELEVPDNSPVLNKTVAQVNLRQECGVSLLAILRKQTVITPTADSVFLSGDELIVLGTAEQLSKLEAIF